MSGAFWTSTLRRRRKAHRCDVCGQVVAPGQLSYDEAGTFDGDFTSYRQCQGCADIVRYFFWRGDFEHGEGFMLSDVADCARERGILWPPVYGYIDPELPTNNGETGQ